MELSTVLSKVFIPQAPKVCSFFLLKVLSSSTLLYFTLLYFTLLYFTLLYFTLSVLLYHPGRRGEKELSVCGKFEGLGGWDVVGLQLFFHILSPVFLGLPLASDSLILEQRKDVRTQSKGKTILLYLLISRSLADRWGTTEDFTTNLLHSSRFSAFRSMMFHSRPVQSLMLSSHRFLCLPLRLHPCTVTCSTVLASPDDRVTCAYHLSLSLFTGQEVFIRPDGIVNSGFTSFLVM